MYTTSNTPHDIIRAHYHTIACPCSAISINADHPRDTRPDTAGVAGLTLIHLAMKALYICIFDLSNCYLKLKVVVTFCLKLLKKTEQ